MINMISPLLSVDFEMDPELIPRVQSSKVSLSSSDASSYHPNDIHQTAVSDISIDSAKEGFDQLHNDDSSSDDDSDEEDQHIFSAVQSAVYNSK